MVGKRKAEGDGADLHLASEEILAAALRTEVDRKNVRAAAALAILMWRLDLNDTKSGKSG